MPTSKHLEDERCQPILDVLGKQRLYLGSRGNGTTTKLVVNLLLGLGRPALEEALVLGEKAGQEREQLIEVIKQAAMVSPRQQADLEHARLRAYPAEFVLAFMSKDVQLIFDEAFEAFAPLPMTAVAQQITAAAQPGSGEADAPRSSRFWKPSLAPRLYPEIISVIVTSAIRNHRVPWRDLNKSRREEEYHIVLPHLNRATMRPSKSKVTMTALRRFWCRMGFAHCRHLLSYQKPDRRRAQ